ncbi:MAG: Gfo/Idh/MocA family oxidoreductase [Provencibacterium sp.]|jgi:UDP-N-acetyl-2-amino-2-deoxyglucuronate dehydrogenase|nr:Gfo/Idh/MocA family oxidoreductase [Provencibacterium sp.]
MKKFRIGIVGCGRISVVYQNAFQEMGEEIEVCFAVDKDIRRAQAFASRFEGCAFSDRLEDLLAAKLDAVHICTPHFLHKEQAIACLKAGFHVLTEKPIALSLPDAQEMIRTAADCGKSLGVIFQNRYIEGVQQARQLIASGAFGRILGAWSSLNWHRPPSYYECDWKGSWEKEGGGVVIDQAIHSIDLARYLMGCEARSVQGHIARRILTNIEVEDEADAAFTFENGAVYAFSACNYYVKNSPIRVEISGEKGRCLLTGMEMEIELEGQAPYRVLPQAAANGGESYWGAYHGIQIRDFYRKLAAGDPVPVDPADATKTLELVLGLYTSAKEDRTVLLG